MRYLLLIAVLATGFLYYILSYGAQLTAQSIQADTAAQKADMDAILN
jgi:hypothetical protein